MPLNFPASPSTNDTYSFNNRTWIFNGEAWDVVPDQGIQGSQGTQGLQGPQGPQGIFGTQGRQGTQGLQGLSNQGVQGTFGTQGRQGTQGTQGLGAQGTQGLQGTFGTQGRQGTQGLQGVQGLSNQGVQGNQGPQGTFGAQGRQGTQGLQGVQGLSNQGTQGTQGPQGTFGTQGRQGTQGLSNQGVQGTQGLQGLQGSLGTQGTQGLQGVQGLSNQGVQGNQGPQGTFGAQGRQGTQGLQGVQGLSNQGTQGLQGVQGSLAGAPSGGSFDTGITTTKYFPASNDIDGFTAIGVTFPSTSGKRYVVESILVTNVSAGDLYVSSRIDYTAGQKVPYANKILIPEQGAIDIIDEPIINNPSDNLRFAAYNGIGVTASGVLNGLDCFVSYFEKDDTDYVGIGSSISNTFVDETVYTSDTFPSVINTITLTNYSDVADLDASVSLFRGGTIRQGYFVYNLTIPQNSVIQILQKPKRLEPSDTLVVRSSSSYLGVTVAGKYIT